MRKILLITIFFATFFAFQSCTDNITDDDLHPQDDQTLVSRSAGDNKFDVLGWGYDAMGEYLSPESVKGRVLDIDRYKSDYEYRIVVQTNSWGSDFFSAGATAEEYLKEVTQKSNAGVGTALFSGTFTKSKEFYDKYTYSSKYAFASLDCIRNRRILYINDDKSRLTDYLSPEFTEDLSRYTADKIIEIYGTHVLTHITLGGRYKLMYRSCFTKQTDKATRHKIVKAGLGGLLNKIGLKFNTGGETITNEELAKENTSQELYVLFYGGNGTNIKYNLDSTTPTTIDIQNWDSQISLSGTSVLTNIQWEKAYPLYEFVQDPAKKAALKSAIERHMSSKKIEVLELLPFYELWYAKNKDTFYTNSWEEVLKQQREGRTLRGLKGYILANKGTNTLPLYNMWYLKNHDSFYCTSWEEVQKQIKDGREYFSQAGYILAKPENNTLPLYPMWYQTTKDSFYCMSWAEVQAQIKQGRKYFGGIDGYIYDAY